MICPVCWFPCSFCEIQRLFFTRSTQSARCSKLITLLILALQNPFGTEYIITADTQLSDVSSSAAYLVEILHKNYVSRKVNPTSECGLFLWGIKMLKKCTGFRDDWLAFPKNELYWRKTYHWFGLIYILYSGFKTIVNLITHTAILPSAMSN